MSEATVFILWGALLISLGTSYFLIMKFIKTRRDFDGLIEDFRTESRTNHKQITDLEILRDKAERKARNFKDQNAKLQEVNERLANIVKNGDTRRGYTPPKVVPSSKIDSDLSEADEYVDAEVRDKILRRFSQLNDPMLTVLSEDAPKFVRVELDKE
ncbi:hypothetical protein PBI_CANTARE_85 [Brevibacterium phage Cantare]|uniref:Uncharacterized protein n=1 Tax=Brevibacterium phage Cantare TaxID=2338395 RepID=A0A3G3LYZ3_9CAUD|nr:hypothetical protein PQD70_gp085 [Brevibacterium phage Cantare]AYQ99305.1 hypothetical protein PBI_CANTARE_85 [Brevibacterium phage Cantare]